MAVTQNLHEGILVCYLHSVTVHSYSYPTINVNIVNFCPLSEACCIQAIGYTIIGAASIVNMYFSLHPGDTICSVNGHSINLENIDSVLAGLSNEVCVLCYCCPWIIHCMPFVCLCTCVYTQLK